MSSYRLHVYKYHENVWESSHALDTQDGHQKSTLWTLSKNFQALALSSGQLENCSSAENLE